jgi:hypothetical protein
MIFPKLFALIISTFQLRSHAAVGVPAKSLSFSLSIKITEIPKEIKVFNPVLENLLTNIYISWAEVIGFENVVGGTPTTAGDFDILMMGKIRKVI